MCEILLYSFICNTNYDFKMISAENSRISFRFSSNIVYGKKIWIIHHNLVRDRLLILFDYTHLFGSVPKFDFAIYYQRMRFNIKAKPRLNSDYYFNDVK